MPLATSLLLAALASAPDARAADDLDAIWQAELHRLPTSSLIPYVGHDDPEIRARAALALGRLRDPEALVGLEALAADADRDVRLSAAFALGLTPGGDTLIRKILPVEPDADVRARLLAGLGLHARAELDLSDDIAVLVSALGPAGAASAAAGRPEAREAAVALGRMGIAGVDAAEDPAVLRALVKQMGDPLDLDARRAAAFALARISPTAPPLDVEAALWRAADRDRDPVVRALSVRALRVSAVERGQIGDLLEIALGDPDKDVRVAGARALAAATPRDPWPWLERLLADSDRSVRREAISAAGAQPNIDHAALLGPALEGDDDGLRAEAISALARAGALDDTRAWLQPDQPMAVQRAAVGGIEDTGQLIRLATGSNEPGLRTAAAARLLDLDPSSGSALALMESEDPLIAAVGIGALQDAPDREAAPAVVAWMEKTDNLDVWREGLATLDVLLGARAEATEALEAVVASAQASDQLPVRAAAEAPASRLGLEPPAPAAPGDPPVTRAEIERARSARIITDVGEIRVALFPDVAPLTVWNFVTLAEKDYFDGLAFHRVVPDFVIQDGCPRGDGWGDPGYAIPDELSWLPYDTGTLGMALSGPDTGGSQWFITLSPQPHLEAGYTVFGQLSLQSGAIKRVQQGTQILDVIIERLPEDS